MAKGDFIDTPLRLFVTLDAKEQPSGFQLEFQRRVDDGNGGDLVAPTIQVRDMTAEEVNGKLTSSAVTQQADIKAAHDQIVQMQADATTAQQQLDAANTSVASLQAVISTIRAALPAPPPPPPASPT